MAVRAAAIFGAGLLTACLACAPERPSIVLVLVDELRKDAFDAWASRTVELSSWGGVGFEQMRSVAPWTYPSVVSLLSGLYPQQHGADGESRANLLRRFSPEVPLLQRTLREAGYRTTAFVANPFLREWNPFHQGFDTYRSDFVRDVGNRRPAYPEFATPDMFSPTLVGELRRHLDGLPADAPDFVYLHLIDVHGPWDGAPFAPSYRAAVEFVDGQIVELYEYFLERSRGDLLFFVTSDHGRSLGDDLRVGYGPHFRVMKKSLHDFNLRIPFVVLPSPAVKGRGRVDVPCSNIDFVPTVLDLLDLRSEQPLPGRSLAPWMRGEPPPPGPAPPAYARMSAFGVESDALIHEDRKYLRFRRDEPAAGPARRVFDLQGDPRETRSLGEDFGSAQQLIDEAAGPHGLSFESARETADPELEGQLRALGYLD